MQSKALTIFKYKSFSHSPEKLSQYKAQLRNQQIWKIRGDISLLRRVALTRFPTGIIKSLDADIYSNFQDAAYQLISNLEQALDQVKHTILICKHCKQQLSNKPNRAKPVTYGICKLCSTAGEGLFKYHKHKDN